MCETINIQIEINGNAPDYSSLISEREREFHPLFERLIDRGDSRVTVLDDSMLVQAVEINGNQGCASISFDSEFYAGCKDMNSIDEHETTLDFEIEDDMMLFSIPLPDAWIHEY